MQGFKIHDAARLSRHYSWLPLELTIQKEILNFHKIDQPVGVVSENKSVCRASVFHLSNYQSKSNNEWNQWFLITSQCHIVCDSVWHWGYVLTIKGTRKKSRFCRCKKQRRARCKRWVTCPPTTNRFACLYPYRKTSQHRRSSTCKQVTWRTESQRKLW